MVLLIQTNFFVANISRRISVRLSLFAIACGLPVVVLGCAGSDSLPPKVSSSPSTQESPQTRPYAGLEPAHRVMDEGERVRIVLMQPPPDGIGPFEGYPNDRFQAQSATIDEPMSLKVVTPEGKELDVPSKLTFVHTTAKRVGWITVLPLATAAEFREVVHEIRLLLEAWEIEPNEDIRGWIEEDTNWPGNEKVPMALPFGTQVEATATVGIGIGIKPASDRGWFLSLTFAVKEAERYRLLPPEDRPEPYR